MVERCLGNGDRGRCGRRCVESHDEDDDVSVCESAIGEAWV